MSWFSAIGSAVSGIFESISGPINEWQKRKTVKAQGEMEVTKLHAQAAVARAQAMVEMAKQGLQVEADWDERAQMDARTSWKDEFLMVIFVAPFVCMFLPELQTYVVAGFDAADKLPLWYQAVLLGIVAAVFGLRWLVAPLIKGLFRLRQTKDTPLFDGRYKDVVSSAGRDEE